MDECKKWKRHTFPDPLLSPSIIIPWLGFYLYISLIIRLIYKYFLFSKIILLKRKLIEGTTSYDCINMQYWT